jgi:2-polyprenyl-3-methyl-5-hydroxy-6-metoxy-1,4-benzoquinol methylase
MPNRCLEVGCATGEFCYLLSQLRCSAVGIDLSEQAIRVAQARYPGLDFRCGVLADLAPSARFDAIFGYEVIEHVLSPRQFLRTAANHLEQGGTLVLTTPNMDCGRTVGVERWMGFLLSFEHLYFFSPSTLHEYARQEGFELVAWLTGGGEGLLPQAPKRHSFRDLVKYGLDRLKLFGIAHEVWDLLKPSRPYQVEPKNDYIIGGQAHNLFVLLRKT